MPNVNIYLADLPGVVTNKDTIAQAVSALMSRAASGGPIDATFAVSWVTSAPASMGANDLLCYFVRHRSDTILGSAPGLGPNETPPSGLVGWTRFQTGDNGMAGSEGYYNEVSSRDAAFGARIVIHELMHNMARQGDSMHAPGLSIGAETFNGTTPLSDGDIRHIKRHVLTTRRSQWTGGWSAYNDPLRGI